MFLGIVAFSALISGLSGQYIFQEDIYGDYGVRLRVM